MTKRIPYHLSGLLSKTKSTLCPFSLRMLAAIAAHPWSSSSKAQTMLCTCKLSSGRRPFSLSNCCIKQRWSIVEKGGKQSLLASYKNKGNISVGSKNQH